MLINQVEDYYRFLKQFAKIEDRLQALISQRNETYQQLAACSKTHKDLKLFASKAPRIMQMLRE